MTSLPVFSGIVVSEIELHLIENSNQGEVKHLFDVFPDAVIMHAEIDKSYLPCFDSEGRRTKWGFWVQSGDEIAGLCLLGVSSWKNLRGYTGTDILSHMRGRGISPATKPLLFYLGFHQLGLNRIETGCFVSNISSQKAIEKTAGFQFEGILRAYAMNHEGIFEDERRYAILKKDWENLYDPSGITILS